MDHDRLNEYIESELSTGKARIAEIANADGGPKHNLRLLYDVPLHKKVVYAESGGLSNIALFPEDTTIIMPVFPWSEADINRTIGPLSTLRDFIDRGRIFPIVQHPLYYLECPHLHFLFEQGSPSYFIRGAFAYAAVLGIPSEIKFNEVGIPVLAEVDRLMQHCAHAHVTWLQYAKEHRTCWEYRYRSHSQLDQRFYNRLHSSLCYRYASVALCVGELNADRIISVFSPVQASEILLHLHILFDHIMCHGVGSDFVVHSDTPDGIDFKRSKETGITRPHELDITKNLRLALPVVEDDYIRALLQEEHFFREVNFSLLTRESLPDVQHQLDRQFTEFQKKVDAVSKGKEQIQFGVQITLYSMSVAAIVAGAHLGGAIGVIGGLNVPWLAEVVASRLERIHRDKLASYCINSYSRAKR